jgi:exo-1,4-beta-D-glucosaminidase
MNIRALVACICLWFEATRAEGGPVPGAALVSENGRTAVIPSWRIRSSAGETAEADTISQPGFAASSWQHVNASRCTLMGCLLQSGLYDVRNLFYSNNLNQLDTEQFRIPWFYRNEFTLRLGPHRHFHLQTHGISSKADIFLNGHQIASREVHSGAYGGRTFYISSAVADGTNALAIRVHPTNYNYDFAVGFVDWNPHPPDRGMGVWRHVEIKQTGPVILGPLLVSTKLEVPSGIGHAAVTLKATMQNLEDVQAAVTINGIIARDTGQTLISWEETLQVAPMGSATWSKTVAIDSPAIWWPKQWGEQPLYLANLTIFANGARSDAADKSFGIRNVTSVLNSHNDTTFSINGKPFQVIGAGYAPELFLRWDSEKFKAQCQYALDLGLNTLRLEGKMEQPELYDITDRLGLMVLPGWECCNKWEAWSYNGDFPVSPVPIWNTSDYETANASMRHEALMLQSHPSVLGYLVGSDYWPDDAATAIYIDAMQDAEWQTPILSSASKRGYPEALGPSGMKMNGPYDWVPPNYWFDTEPSSQRAGAAFGFGSELGAGVGTPELSSLKNFLSPEDMGDLWLTSNKTLFHLSLNGSQFDNRAIYNEALWQRYGTPTSLEDYILKSQIMDYEATRAEFEAFASRWGAERPATGLIYWMFNNAWPSLHWNLFDYFLHPAGSYFGTKVGCRMEHVAYDYAQSKVYLVNRSLNNAGLRTVQLETITPGGEVLHNNTMSVQTVPNTSKAIGQVPLPGGRADVIFLKLKLFGSDGTTLSRNVYWLSNTLDALDWNASTWYHTPVLKYVDFKSLAKLASAQVSAKRSEAPATGPGTRRNSLVLENHSLVPAFFVRLNLASKDGRDIAPVFWSDNYVTLWPHEQLVVEIGHNQDGNEVLKVQISGMNVAPAEVDIDGGWVENHSSRSASPMLSTIFLLLLSAMDGIY